MSSRKLTQQRLFRNTTPTGSRTNLNSTMLVTSSRGSSTKSKPPFTLNTTMQCSPSMQRAPVVDTQENETELAYNAYIQSVFKKIILKKAIREKKIECNDILECQREKISDLMLKEVELLGEIEEAELKKSLGKELEELKDMVDKSSRIIDSNVGKDVGRFVEFVSNANNKMFLVNVLPLKSKEEYEKLSGLIGEISGLLKKLFELIGDVDGIKALADCLRGNLEKFKEVEIKSNSIEKCQNEVAETTLEKASDYLASKLNS